MSFGSAFGSAADPPRLVLMQGDRARIDKMLGDYLRTVRAICVLIVDRYGERLAMQGSSSGLDLDIVSALVAGAVEVSHQMSKALKKDAFSIIFHEGPRDNVQISMIGRHWILAVVFDSTATLGMVRLYAKTLTSQLELLLEQIASRPAPKG